MLKASILIVITISSLIMPSCARTETPKLEKGTLIWTAGNNFIYQWNAATGKRSVLLRLPYGSLITGLTDLDSNTIIFSMEQTTGKNVNPYNPENRMYIFNVKTKKLDFCVMVWLRPMYPNTASCFL